MVVAAQARLVGGTPQGGSGMAAWELGCYGHGPGVAWHDQEEAAGDLAALFCHGTGDRVVTMQFGERLYGRTRDIGLDAEVRQFEGLGHALCAAELVELRAFIAKRCLPGGGGNYGQQPLTGGKSQIGRRWGDGSPVSGRGGEVTEGDLERQAEASLGEFADGWSDPAGEVWRFHLKLTRRV